MEDKESVDEEEHLGVSEPDMRKQRRQKGVNIIHKN